jgi:hypothetical protein
MHLLKKHTTGLYFKGHFWIFKKITKITREWVACSGLKWSEMVEKVEILKTQTQAARYKV